MPKALQASLANNVDDSAPIDAVTVNAFSTLSKLFPKAGYDASKLQTMAKDPEQSNSEGDSTGLEYAWSGIIGVVSSLGRTGRGLCLIGPTNRQRIPYRLSEKFQESLGNISVLDSMAMVSR
jgi:hypothetical protein